MLWPDPKERLSAIEILSKLHAVKLIAFIYVCLFYKLVYMNFFHPLGVGFGVALICFGVNCQMLQIENGREERDH